jgi:hypothetical protein
MNVRNARFVIGHQTLDDAKGNERKYRLAGRPHPLSAYALSAAPRHVGPSLAFVLADEGFGVDIVDVNAEPFSTNHGRSHCPSSPLIHN